MPLTPASQSLIPSRRSCQVGLRASAMAFRNEWLQEDDWKQYRIRGGYQKLIDFLAKEIKAKAVQ